MRLLFSCRQSEHRRDFGNLFPKISDYANAPTTERLCRDVVGAGKVVGACTGRAQKGGDEMGQKDDVLTDDLVKNVIRNFR
jgi:hypothetical protein